MLHQRHLVLAGHRELSSGILLLCLLLLHLLPLKGVLQLLGRLLALPCGAIALLGEALLALQLCNKLRVLQLLILQRLCCTW